MFLLDLYANQSIMKNFHPGEKALFTFVCLFIALFFSLNAVSIAVMIVISFILFIVIKLPLRFFLKLLFLPFSFLAMGCIAVALEISANPGIQLFYIELGRFFIGVSRDSLLMALNLLLRSMSALFAIYFLVLTTPFSDLSWLLARLRVPSLFIELASLTYRFIFVLAETAANTYIAQNSRLGYSTWKNTFNSLGKLSANVLIKSWHRSQMMHNALISRCYDGEIKVLERHFHFSPKNWIFTAMAAVLFAAIAHLFP